MIEEVGANNDLDNVKQCVQCFTAIHAQNLFDTCHQCFDQIEGSALSNLGIKEQTVQCEMPPPTSPLLNRIVDFLLEIYELQHEDEFNYLELSSSWESKAEKLLIEISKINYPAIVEKNTKKSAWLKNPNMSKNDRVLLSTPKIVKRVEELALEYRTTQTQIANRMGFPRLSSIPGMGSKYDTIQTNKSDVLLNFLGQGILADA